MDHEQKLSIRIKERRGCSRRLFLVVTPACPETLLLEASNSRSNLFNRAAGDVVIVGAEMLPRSSPRLESAKKRFAHPWQVRDQGIGKELVNRWVECAKAEKVREVMAITATEQLFQECGLNSR